MVEGRVQCPYHGWEYDSAGACTKMPSTAFSKVGGTCLNSRPSFVHAGMPRWGGSNVKPRVAHSPASLRAPSSPPRPPILSHALPQGITVDALPVVEADGLVWIWPGSPEAMTGGPPEVARPPPGFQVWHWRLSSG